MKSASQQAWFKNTIFVFLGDHGINLGHTYDMPLSYHHVPFIIYSPLFTENKSLTSLGGQIDVFPTLLGLLPITYTNHSLGIDLLKERRPFIFFTADDKIGCLNKEYYFIHRNVTGKETLFSYGSLSHSDNSGKLPELMDSLKNYSFSMLQVASEFSKK